MIGCAMARLAGLAALGALMCGLLGGCATRLPTYPAMSDAEALGVVAARLDSVKSVSASADLLLTNAKGETVTLDGAFVATPPERGRLRAWKFGSPVLDLTILPTGVFAFTAEREGAAPGDLTKLPSAGVRRALELMTGTYFRTAHATPEQRTPGRIVVSGPALGQDAVVCEIDRATLTPREFRIAIHEKEHEGEAMVLSLDQYAVVGGVAWAKRMLFESPDGSIEIRLSGVELNGEVGARAFVPPARAAKLP